MALTPWATHVIQWPVQRAAKPRGGANRIKTGLSSDWRLQLASMKSDLLVNVGQHTTLNTFPGLVHTARHVTEVVNTRSAYFLGPKVGVVTGMKS
jgi:hypothetical protein